MNDGAGCAPDDGSHPAFNIAAAIVRFYEVL
jgi:hypothetical protein